MYEGLSFRQHHHLRRIQAYTYTLCVLKQINKNRKRVFFARVALMLAYIKEVYLFDFKYGTLTGVTVKPESVQSSGLTPQDVPHMPSFSNSIIEAHRLLLQIRPESFQWPFFDVGCGSGKAMIMWKLLNQAKGISQNITGTEIDKNLRSLAEMNVEIVGLSISVSDVDAFSPKFQQLVKSKCVMFLYNPFGLKGIELFMQNIANLEEVLLVYVNPRHISEFRQKGFRVVAEKKSWHESMNISILERATATI